MYVCIYVCVYMYNKHFYNLLFEKRFKWFIAKGIYNKANTIKSRTNKYVNIKSMTE